MSTQTASAAKQDKTATDSADKVELEKARESAREAYDKFQEARKHLKSAALNAGVDMKESANDYLEETVDSVSSKGREMYNDAESYVHKNPLRSAGLAFAAGFLLSRITR